MAQAAASIDPCRPELCRANLAVHGTSNRITRVRHARAGSSGNTRLVLANWKKPDEIDRVKHRILAQALLFLSSCGIPKPDCRKPVLPKPDRITGEAGSLVPETRCYITELLPLPIGRSWRSPEICSKLPTFGAGFPYQGIEQFPPMAFPNPEFSPSPSICAETIQLRHD